MLHYCDNAVTAKLGMSEFKKLMLLAVLTLGAAGANAAQQSAERSPCAADSSPGPATSSRTVEMTLAGVPAILRVPASIRKPPIVLWHGLGPPASESDLMKDLPLDDVPAVKVYLGLPLFGARAPAAGAESLAQRQSQDYALKIFDPVVVGAARELPTVLNELHKLGCLRTHDKVGLFGFSAGGAAVLVALMDPKAPVSVAVTINAPSGLRSAVVAFERATKQPYAWSDASRQLAERTDAAQHASLIAGSASQPRALLLLQGADDNMIAPADAISLAEALRPVFQRSGSEQRLRLTVAPGISHNWADPRTIEQVRTEVGDWFNRHL